MSAGSGGGLIPSSGGEGSEEMRWCPPEREGPLWVTGISPTQPSAASCEQVPWQWYTHPGAGVNCRCPAQSLGTALSWRFGERPGPAAAAGSDQEPTAELFQEGVGSPVSASERRLLRHQR